MKTTMLALVASAFAFGQMAEVPLTDLMGTTAAAPVVKTRTGKAATGDDENLSTMALPLVMVGEVNMARFSVGFTLLNQTDEAARVTIEFMGPDGQPIGLPVLMANSSTTDYVGLNGTLAARAATGATLRGNGRALQTAWVRVRSSPANAIALQMNTTYQLDVRQATWGAFLTRPMDTGKRSLTIVSKYEGTAPDYQLLNTSEEPAAFGVLARSANGQAVCPAVYLTAEPRQMVELKASQNSCLSRLSGDVLLQVISTKPGLLGAARILSGQAMNTWEPWLGVE